MAFCSFKITGRRFLESSLLALIALLLGSCGGGDGDGWNATRRASIVGVIPSESPFHSHVVVAADSLDDIASVSFEVEPKAGSASAPLYVTLGKTYLESNQLIHVGELEVPLFGLYSGADNHVRMVLEYSDAERIELSAQITTPEWVDESGIYSQIRVSRSRSDVDHLGFNFLYVKNQIIGPVIYDSDGEVRWVTPSPAVKDGMNAEFVDGQFVVPSIDSPWINLLKLIGGHEVMRVNSDRYTDFHHTSEVGKTGVFGLADAVRENGNRNIENELIEFDLGGNILSSWDISSLLGYYMTSEGDDPSELIRDNDDWFHMNYAIYDDRDDSVIVSGRELFVMKFDYSTGEIRWILGDESKKWAEYPSLLKKSLRLNEGGLAPIGQHGLGLNRDGDLTLFNNGTPSLYHEPAGMSRSYSPVSIYAIDEPGMRAENTRNISPDGPWRSAFCSGVYEAEDGSLLISYAQAESPGDDSGYPKIVGLNSAGKVVFDWRLPLNPAVQHGDNGCRVAHHAKPVALENLELW